VSWGFQIRGIRMSYRKLNEQICEEIESKLQDELNCGAIQEDFIHLVMEVMGSIQFDEIAHDSEYVKELIADSVTDLEDELNGKIEDLEEELEKMIAQSNK